MPTHHGSGGSETDDEWSDVDLDLVVEDAAYADVAAQLRAVCEAECGRIQVWLPEGERPGQFCNYAFLFEAQGEQFLYDFILLSRSFLLSQEQRRPGKVLHDPGGLLVDLQAQRAPRPYTPDGPDGLARPQRLDYAIDQYWVYAYLDGKYWRRRDLPKLLYVQQVLFGVHLRVLRALHPDGEWGWWPRDLQRLPEDTRRALLGYFVPPHFDAIRTALASALAQFGADARAACARWRLLYPEDTERYVRRHLRDAGVLDA
jgi:hypothetical protein